MRLMMNCDTPEQYENVEYSKEVYPSGRKNY